MLIKFIKGAALAVIGIILMFLIVGLVLAGVWILKNYGIPWLFAYVAIFGGIFGIVLGD